MDKGPKVKMKKMRDQKKFRLLGDLAIKGKKKKLLPIIMWLYRHKNEGRELVIEKNHTHKNTLPKDTHTIQKKKKKP